MASVVGMQEAIPLEEKCLTKPKQVSEIVGMRVRRELQPSTLEMTASGR
jgi:hypothetical protein